MLGPLHPILDAITQSFKSPLLLEDHQRTVIFVNSQFCELFLKGVEPATLLNQPTQSLFEAVEASLVEPLGARIFSAAISNRNPEALCQEMVLKNGTFLECDYAALSLPSGSPGHLWIYRDVTPRIQSQSLLEIQRKSLRSTTKLAELGLVASGIGHEINNLLTITQPGVQLITKVFATDKPDLELARNLCERVLSGTHRMVEIVDTLRMFSGNEGDSPLKPLSVKKLVEEAMRLCAPRFSEAHIRVFLPELADNPLVYGKEVQLVQVLLNLLNNAVDAIRESKDPWVKIEVSDSADQTELSVIDSGLGVPEAHRSQIMTPFFTTKGFGKGTGLGLSLSKRMIEEMKGRFFLKDKHPNTCFAIVLPKNLNSSLPQKTILIVDDEPGIQLLLRAEFETRGWKVFLAASGSEALRVLGREKITMILSDIRMRDGDGLELLELSRLGCTTAIPLYLMSGFSDLTEEEALLRGASGLFPKPLDIPAVLLAINQAAMNQEILLRVDT